MPSMLRGTMLLLCGWTALVSGVAVASARPAAAPPAVASPEVAPSLEVEEARRLAANVRAAAPGGVSTAALVRMGTLLELLGAPTLDAALGRALPIARLEPPAAQLAVALRALIDERLGRRSGEVCEVPTSPPAAPPPDAARLYGPFEGSDASALARQTGWERDPAAGPPALGRDGAVRSELVAATPDGLGEAAAALHAGPGSVVVWERWLRVPARTKLELQVGAMGAARLYIDGAEALVMPPPEGPRPLAAAVHVRADLEPGVHRVLLKLADVRGGFAVRVDAVAGAPTWIAPPEGRKVAASSVEAPAPPAWLTRWLTSTGVRASAADDGLAALATLDWPFASYGVATAAAVKQRLEAAATAGAVEPSLALAQLAPTRADRRARCEAALEHAPDEVARLRLGLCVVRELEAAPADVRWRATLAGTERRSVEARSERVDLWLRLGGERAALVLARSGASELGGALAMHQLAARIAAARDDLRGAADALARAAALEPGHRSRQLAWLVAEAAIGSIGRLRGAVGKVRERLGDPAAGALIWARALHEAGDHAAARAALGVERDGGVAALELRARIAEAMGDRAETLAALRAAVAAAPARRDLQARLARLLPPPDPAALAGLDLRDVAIAAHARPIPAVPLTTALRKIRVVEQAAGRALHYEGEVVVIGKGGPRSHRVEVDYVPGQSTVDVLRAQVLRRDGSTVRAVETGVDRITEADLGLYYDLEERWLDFRDLEPGDVLLIETLQRDIAPDPFRLIYGEVFLIGDDRPVERYELEVALRPGAPLHAGSSRHGLPALRRERRPDGGETLLATARDLPAARLEDDGPGPSELVPTLHVSSFAGWREVTSWWAGLLRQSLPPEAAAPLRALATRLTRDARDREHAIALLHRFVADEIRYVGLEFGVHSLRPYPALDVLARRFGDCKDKATLLVGLLEAIGVRAEVTLVRTRHAGGLDAGVLERGEGASVALFDHAIVALPEAKRWLDPTARHHAPYELPDGDRGALALRVPREASDAPVRVQTLPWPRPEDNVREEHLHLEVSPDGSADLAWTVRFEGVAAAPVRERLAAEATREERIVQDASARFPGLEPDAIEVQGAEPPLGHGALVVRVRGRLPRACAPQTDGALRCSPLLSRQSWRARLAPTPDRRSRRLLGTPEQVRLRAVVVPARGWRVRSSAQPAAFDRPELGMGASLTVDVGGGGSSALDLRVRRERAWLQPGEQAAARALADRIDAVTQQSVVLERAEAAP